MSHMDFNNLKAKFLTKWAYVYLGQVIWEQRGRNLSLKYIELKLEVIFKMNFS